MLRLPLPAPSTLRAVHRQMLPQGLRQALQQAVRAHRPVPRRHQRTHRHRHRQPLSSSPPRTSTKRRADLSLASPKVAAWSGGGASVLWILLDGEIAAACQLSDVIRSESRSAMSALKSLNVETTMLTGDAEATAKAVGAQAGIASYRAGMRPNEKLDAVRGHALNGVVGMLGDGVNDGPALAAF